MLVERSDLLIKEGLEGDFATAMVEKGLPLLKTVEGLDSVSLGRGVENTDKFMLLIAWETMDAHVAFTKSPVFLEFRALLSPFTKGGGMEHFNMS